MAIRPRPPSVATKVGLNVFGAASETILIVEDDDALRQVLADQVASSGLFQSIEASTLDEASRYLGAAEARFDSIILDINLPDGDGRDGVRELVRGEAL